MGEFHVIFGTGPVGAATARVLLDSGAKVRLASRSGSRPKAFVNSPGPGEESRIEFVRADAADTAAAMTATEGATHVYDCVNLLYQQRYKDLLPIRRSLIEAAIRQAATLAATFFAAAGKPLKLVILPEAAIAALGLFDPLVREFREMLYQKKEPYRIDGSRFRATFGLEATPVSVGVRQTLDWQAATRAARGGRP